MPANESCRFSVPGSAACSPRSAISATGPAAASCPKPPAPERSGTARQWPEPRPSEENAISSEDTPVAPNEGSREKTAGQPAHHGGFQPEPPCGVPHPFFVGALFVRWRPTFRRMPASLQDLFYRNQPQQIASAARSIAATARLAQRASGASRED